jgi:hypothetical protein
VCVSVLVRVSIPLGDAAPHVKMSRKCSIEQTDDAGIDIRVAISPTFHEQLWRQ